MCIKLLTFVKHIYIYIYIEYIERAARENVNESVSEIVSEIERQGDWYVFSSAIRRRFFWYIYIYIYIYKRV